MSKEENFPRFSVAVLEHLHTGVAFPLHVGKKVLGVVEFFSLEYRVLAPATQDFLFALGGQMGVFLERLSAGKNLEAAIYPFGILLRSIGPDKVIAINGDSFF